ncbi:Chitin synthase export chaperone [Pleurotus pulmonarius]
MLSRRNDATPTIAGAALGSYVVNLSSAASLAFLVWDILITTDDEVDLIWPKPWSMAKFLYLHIRYMPVLVQIAITFVGTQISASFHYTTHDCYIWQIFQGVASVSIIVAVDIILILRVIALYKGHWAIKLSVGILFFTEIVCMGVGLALAIPGIQFGPNCSTTDIPQSLLIYGAGSLLFQITLFLLTAVRFGKAVRDGWGRVPLVEQIMRDGTWAFFLLAAVVIAQAGFYGLKNHAFAALLYGWLLTTFSFVGYRVLLNLQATSVRSSRHPSVPTISRLVYAPVAASLSDNTDRTAASETFDSQTAMKASECVEHC